jgi:hypothetical protein
MLLSLAVGYLVPKLTRKRKVLSWAMLSETALVPSDLNQTVSVPITIQVGGVTPASLTLVSLRIGNSGNEVIENVTAAITLNQGARIIYIKPADSLGEFQKHVERVVTESGATVLFAFINPRNFVDFELLLSDYEEGSLVLDSSGPGLELRRRDATKWDLPTSVLKGFGLSLAGIRYDPAVASMGEIAAELKSLRRLLQKK